VRSVHGPTAGRRKLRTALRAARDEAKLTQEDVAREMDWSLSKLIRIETGRVSISTNDVKALLDLYEIDDEAERDTLVELARLARKKPWWQDFREAVPADYAQFIGLEAEADSLRIYQPTVVPGLLQTEAYGRAILEGRAPSMHISDEEVRARSAVRMLRQQEVLGGESPPKIHVILDEAVLRRVPGDVSILRDQLQQLIRLGSDDHVTVQIVPLAAGAFSAGGHFIIVSFPDDGDSDVVYLETVLDQELIDRKDEAGPYEAEFDRLSRLALSHKDSLAFIEKVAGEL
jgi:transcriptional regulator with XRE-family HTH domain